MDSLRKLLLEIDDLNAELREAGIFEIDVTQETHLLESDEGSKLFGRPLPPEDPPDPSEFKTFSGDLPPEVVNNTKNLPRRPADKNQLLLSMSRTCALLQLFFANLSDIEGGVRADPPDLHRIRLASRRIEKWLPSVAEDFAHFAAWISGSLDDPKDPEPSNVVYNQIMRQFNDARKKR